MRYAAGDLLGLLLFSVLGAAFHGVGLDTGLVVRTFLPLAFSWLGVASAVGTYRSVGWKSFGITWLLAVPLGIVVRQLLLGRLASPGTWTFLLVGTVTSGAVLALVRLAVDRWHRASGPRGVA